MILSSLRLIKCIDCNKSKMIRMHWTIWAVVKFKANMRTKWIKARREDKSKKSVACVKTNHKSTGCSLYNKYLKYLVVKMLI